MADEGETTNPTVHERVTHVDPRVFGAGHPIRREAHQQGEEDQDDERRDRPLDEPPQPGRGEGPCQPGRPALDLAAHDGRAEDETADDRQEVQEQGDGSGASVGYVAEVLLGLVAQGTRRTGGGIDEALLGHLESVEGGGDPERGQDRGEAGQRKGDQLEPMKADADPHRVAAHATAARVPSLLLRPTARWPSTTSSSVAGRPGGSAVTEASATAGARTSASRSPEGPGNIPTT